MPTSLWYEDSHIILGITQSAVECLAQQTVGINWHMRADDEAQRKNVPRNFFHQFYLQIIFRNACLAVLLHRILRYSSSSLLDSWSAHDLVGGATYYTDFRVQRACAIWYRDRTHIRDGHIYIHIYIHTNAIRGCNRIRCLALRRSAINTG